MENALLILLLGSLLATLWPAENQSLAAHIRRWLALAIGPFIVMLTLSMLWG